MISKLYDVFIVGSEDFGCMKFLGFELNQNQHGLSLGLKDYIETIEKIDISSDRACCKKDLLTKVEYTKFRHLLGQINWCTSQIRLDVSFDNCYLQNLVSMICSMPTRLLRN